MLSSCILRQTKIIKEYEKRVNDAKTKIKKQIKQAADLYVAAIRTQQTQMIEELDEMFKNDLQPVQVRLGNDFKNKSSMFRLKSTCQFNLNSYGCISKQPKRLF